MITRRSFMTRIAAAVALIPIAKRRVFASTVAVKPVEQFTIRTERFEGAGCLVGGWFYNTDTVNHKVKLFDGKDILLGTHTIYAGQMMEINFPFMPVHQLKMISDSPLVHARFSWAYR